MPAFSWNIDAALLCLLNELFAVESVQTLTKWFRLLVSLNYRIHAFLVCMLTLKALIAFLFNLIKGAREPTSLKKVSHLYSTLFRFRCIVRRQVHRADYGSGSF